MALSDSRIKKEFTPLELDQHQKAEEEAGYLSEAGLEGRETDKLRSTMLSPDEAVCAKSEQLRDTVQAKGRRSNWEEFVDAKRRMGRVMHHSEFFTRLRRIIPGLLIHDGRVVGTISMYKYDSRVKIIGNRGQEIHGGVIYLGWVHAGDMPEYEIDILNNVQVPISQKRGWRTVLLRLQVHKDELNRPSPIISEEAVLKEFGYPSNGTTASIYRRALWEFRNGKG